MSDEAGNNLTGRELILPVAVCGVPLAIGRHAVELEVWERDEALGLLISGGRMRVAAGKPDPGAVVLVGLPSVDHDLGNIAAQRFENAAPAVPLRIFTGAYEV